MCCRRKSVVKVKTKSPWATSPGFQFPVSSVISLSFEIQSSGLKLINFFSLNLCHPEWKVLKAEKFLVWPIRTRWHTNKQLMSTKAFDFCIYLYCLPSWRTVNGRYHNVEEKLFEIEISIWGKIHTLSALGGLPSHGNVTKNKEGISCMLLLVAGAHTQHESGILILSL